MIVIFAIIEHLACMRRSKPVEAVHERGFAGSGTAYRGHKLALRDGNGDIIENDGFLIALFVKAERIDTNTAALVVLGELGASIGEIERADAYLIAGS